MYFVLNSFVDRNAGDNISLSEDFEVEGLRSLENSNGKTDNNLAFVDRDVSSFRDVPFLSEEDDENLKSFESVSPSLQNIPRSPEM